MSAELAQIMLTDRKWYWIQLKKRQAWIIKPKINNCSEGLWDDSTECIWTGGEFLLRPLTSGYGFSKPYSIIYCSILLLIFTLVFDYEESKFFTPPPPPNQLKGIYTELPPKVQQAWYYKQLGCIFCGQIWWRSFLLFGNLYRITKNNNFIILSKTKR